jgi:hypothetical protein
MQIRIDSQFKRCPVDQTPELESGHDRSREVVSSNPPGGFRICRSASDAAAFANAGTVAQSDINASSEYREHLARVLVRRSLEESGLA